MKKKKKEAASLKGVGWDTEHVFINIWLNVKSFIKPVNNLIFNSVSVQEGSSILNLVLRYAHFWFR